MTPIRRLAAAAAATILTSVLVAGASPTASAAEHDGACQGLELCLYYNSGQAGALHDFRYRVSDFAPYRFLGTGTGAGSPVKNNAASAANRDGYFTARVYFNSGYAGPADDVPPLSARNLGDTYNDNASFNWCHQQPLVCG
ncbi:peptidase inhibitor family I36 protein [Jiangella aurantiaca]|uniref:peptidase inhibitor family I36 protein n=1 Tax=Jiangella aurantiaca TaxID=2530373 RepID=UPI00193C9659|nr:peptidase inhibitor family I36 protein [Jiangella aurantiaca]